MAVPIVNQVINRGQFLDDPTAENVYTAFGKTKENFANLFLLVENQGYEKIFLDLTGIDTTDKTELEYVSEAIERGRLVGGSYGTPFLVYPQGRQPLFYTATPNGTGENAGFDFRYYRVHRKGQVFGGIGGVFIDSDQISPAGSFSVGSSDNPNTNDIYIQLGNIGSANVWDAFNQGKPAPDLGDPWTISGLSLVTATQNGVNRTWTFIGNQRLGLETGDWGGSDVMNPNYLAATSQDFDLLSNQPVVFPDIFITKSSKKYRKIIINSGADKQLLLTPESTTFYIEISILGTGYISGFNTFTAPGGSASYDGTDVYIKNTSDVSLVLKHNEGVDIPFFFKNESNITLIKGDVLQLKYNSRLNRVEDVGVSLDQNKPIPFGNLRILKNESNSNNNIIEIGDVVTASMLNGNVFLTFGEYTGGDKMEVTSYDALTIDKYDL